MYYINTRQEKILELISKFGCMRYKNINKLAHIKDLKRQFKNLIRQNRIELVCDDIYVLKGKKELDKKMIKALDLYVYLINDMKMQIKCCMIEKFPFKLALFKENRAFDIAVIDEGEEVIYSGAVNRSFGERVIIILDNKKQAEKIKINKMVKYCTVKHGAVNFFEKVSEVDE
ncbi:MULTISPECIES: DUF5697 family protein [Clostridium]|uniref:DUF5697 family protein n=1 Tax=Clostridium TaxID=1485 RepID=UPI0008271D3D|nr:MULTISPECIES: DUF5697 family protein [Clostridium]PJI10086.1 hypothetical protein CUB90_20405 [Clostridium sp. CT7]